MADNVTTQSTTLATVPDGTAIASDDVAGVQYQKIKLVDGTADSTAVIPGDATNGLDVDVTRVGGNVTVVQGTATNLKVDASGVAVPVTDNGSTLSVDDGGGNLSIDDGGNSITVDGTVGVSGTVTVDSELTTADLDSGAGTDTRAVVGLVIAKSGGAANVSNTDPIPVSDAGGNLSIDDGGNSITVDNATISVVGSGTEATAQRVTIATDSTGVLSVDDNGSTLSVDDGAGSLTVDNATISVVGGGTEATAQRVTIANDSTGVLSVDDNGSSLTVDNATISVVGGGTEATAQRVTIANDSTGVLSVDDNGGSLTIDGTVTASNTAGDIAHDSADSGNPVKVGAKAANALPTAVANNDRTNNISDLFGRVLTSHIDPGMQSWKSANYTTTQTGTTIWDPAAGKKIALQYLAVSSYGTTGARVIIWFGATADTTYSAGTDQLVWAGSFAPSASAKPGMVLPLGISPIFAATADHELKITTDAGISIDVTAYGYEF